MTELQNNYEDLREQITQRMEELTRLRRELAEKTVKSPGGTGQMNRYEEIVGPVIEEHEKAIRAMEAELSLNRTALRHTNEMYEEREEELAILRERHSATEMYVEELRNRAAGLMEREASTEVSLEPKALSLCLEPVKNELSNIDCDSREGCKPAHDRGTV